MKKAQVFKETNKKINQKGKGKGTKKVAKIIQRQSSGDRGKIANSKHLQISKLQNTHFNRIA